MYTPAINSGIPHSTPLLERRRDWLHHTPGLDHDPGLGCVLKRRLGGPFGSDGHSETPLILALGLEGVREGRGLELDRLPHKMSAHGLVVVG